MHTVFVVALPDTIAFDLATPIEVFGRVRLPGGAPGYRVEVAAPSPVVDAGPLRLAAGHGLEALDHADTVIVPGRNDVLAPESEAVLAALRRAAAAGTRIASICAGAFTLAAAGLLDGRPATTHWVATALFRQLYPTVALDPDVLYVDDGQIVTSAGASAGIDMCLHLVRRDFGAAVAADAARLAVAPLHREGGQAQYIIRPFPSSSGGLIPVLQWLEEQAGRPVSLADIAARAGLSIRTLNRRFHEETGGTPMQWLAAARVRRAQELLEATDHGVDRVADLAGFASPTNFRAQFKRHAGVSPQTYRQTFRLGRSAPAQDSLPEREPIGALDPMRVREG